MHIPALARRKVRRLAPQPDAPVGPRPRILHDLVIEQGPACRPVDRPLKKKPPHLTWTLQCRDCGKCAVGTNKWPRLVNTLCGACPQRIHANQSKERHQVERYSHGWWCRRCGLRGTAAQRSVMLRSGCPARAVQGPPGVVGPAVEAWRRFDIGLSLAWRRWCGGEEMAEELAPPSARQLHAGRSSLQPLCLRWQCHWALTAGGRELCVRCGVGPRAVGRVRLGDTPCPGSRPLRASALIALRQGPFGQALANAPALWQAKVRASALR